MSEGKWVLAKIAAVQLRMPDLPDDESVIRVQKAAGLRRFNPNHYPANSGRGGQFAPRRNVTMVRRNASPIKVAHHLRKMLLDENSPMRSTRHGLHCAVSMMSPGAVASSTLA